MMIGSCSDRKPDCWSALCARRDDAVSTENLTTLFAVVPKSGKGEWLSSYEQLSDFVVRSSRCPWVPDTALLLCTLLVSSCLVR